VWDALPVYGIEVQLNVPQAKGGAARLLVAEQTIELSQRDGRLHFTIPQILDHEVIVIE
jgi:hypothetical protein